MDPKINFQSGRTPVPPMQRTVGTPAVEPMRPQAPLDYATYIQQQQQTGQQGIPPVQPGQPGQPVQDPNAPTTSAPEPAKKSGGNPIIMAFLGILAFAGLVLGIWGLTSSASSEQAITELKSQNAKNEAIVKALAEQTGHEINSAEDIPTFSVDADTIYLGQWGIKIKVINNLTMLSYIVDQDGNYRPRICFNGEVQQGTQYTLAAADVNQNPGGMGCLVRIKASDGDSDSDGVSFGDKVITVNSYNFFYQKPKAVFSTSSSDKDLEASAVNLIKTMLTKNVEKF